MKNQLGLPQYAISSKEDMAYSCRHFTDNHGQAVKDHAFNAVNNQSVETKFPAIIFNDNLTSNETLSCEPTVSSLKDNEIDFKISFDEPDDEDYTVVYDENSFYYKIISVSNLKTDSENDNEKVNVSSFPSPEPEDTDNDNDKIDIEQPSRDMSVIPSPNIINVDTQGSNKLLETSHDKDGIKLGQV
ncbi:hypothetical protein Tco_0403541 [Tanacetum coccineum]